MADGILRDHFDIFRTRNYVNSCSYGALSDEVRGAYLDYLALRDEKGAPWDDFVAKNEEVRGLFASLIGASTAEVAVTTSASASLNAFVAGLDLSGKRNKVVLSDFEFPTVGQIWLAQERRGARISFVPERDGALDAEDFEALIDDETLLVSIAHVCYRNGAMNPVEDVVRIARERGAMVLLDAYQALGAVPIDVKALGVDVLIGGALKYLLASAGTGFLYVREGLVPNLDPFITGWFAQENVAAMDHRHHRPAQSARRFESGTPPVPSLFAVAAGIRLVQTIGVETIQAHVRGLTRELKEGIVELGGRLASPADNHRHGALIAVRSSDVEELVRRLGAQDIIVSSRDGNLRISPHFYNSSEDIATLLQRLRDNRSLLA